MSAAERQQQLSASFNRLGTLLSRPLVRNVLGQAQPKLDFRRVLAKQQIVLVSLSPSRVGGAAVRLVGAICLFALFTAVQSRTQLAPEARRPFQIFLDEPKVLGDIPIPLDAMFEQFRGLGCPLTIAPQSPTQLPGPLREAILTNAATQVIFRQNADDARLLARDLRGISPDDLADLGQFEAVARIALGPGHVAPPVTIRTDPPCEVIADAPEVRRLAAERSGVTLAEVDEGLAAKHRPQLDEQPAIGRKRRTP